VHDAVAENPDGTVPMRILVSLPLSVIFADANRLSRAISWAFALATLLLVLGAWYGTELFVLRSIRALLDAARRVRSGDLGARTRLRQVNDELSQVGRAFDEMAETLQQRDADLRKAVHELKEQAVTDPLTGLYNRRHLRDRPVRAEIMRAKRTNSPLAALMVDVDHFKRINDALGHEAGDMVLKELSALFKRCIRGKRYRLPGTGARSSCSFCPKPRLDGARSKAEDIRNAVKSMG